MRLNFVKTLAAFLALIALSLIDLKAADNTPADGLGLGGFKTNGSPNALAMHANDVGGLDSAGIPVGANSPGPAVGSDNQVPGKSRYSFVFDITIMSQYYGTYVGGIFNPNPFSFNSLTLNRSDSLGSTYASVSVDRQIAGDFNKRPNSDEYDFSLGRVLMLGPTNFPVKIDFTLCYEALVNLDLMKDDVLEECLRVDLPKVPFVTPYVEAIRFDFLGKVPGSGWFFFGGLTREQSLKGLGLSINREPLKALIDFRVGYSGGCFGAHQELEYYRLGVGLPIKLSKLSDHRLPGLLRGLTITPSVVGQLPAGHQGPGYRFADQPRCFGVIDFNWKF